MKVFIPSFAFPEMSYSTKYIIQECLGIKYETDISENEHVEILINDYKIRITNSFFNESIDFQDHYSIDNIPNDVDRKEIIIGSKSHDIISIFGKSQINISGQLLTLDSDIISSSYFMLSRWEENIGQARDRHNRFIGKSSIAYKHGFHKRPIVNEYAELLWSIFEFCGIEQNRKKHTYSIQATHDIDKLYYVDSRIDKINKKVKALIDKKHRGESKEVSLLSKDPYDNYDLFVEKAKSTGRPAIFFFLVGKSSKYDFKRSFSKVQLKGIVKNLINKNQKIGLHPSYDGGKNTTLFKQEKETLEEIASQEITLSRNHFLRLDYPLGYSLLENAGITEDYTMGYPDIIGFRSGTCYPHQVFDYKSRKTINVTTHPLNIMDVTLKDYLELDATQSIETIAKVKDTIRKYGGQFCFLWHNSSFYVQGWESYEKVYNYFYYQKLS